METSARDVHVDVKVYEVGILRTCQDLDESLLRHDCYLYLRVEFRI